MPTEILTTEELLDSKSVNSEEPEIRTTEALLSQSTDIQTKVGDIRTTEELLGHTPETPLPERIGKGLGMGVAGTVEATGGLLKWFGAEKVGKAFTDYASEMKQFYSVPDPKFVDQIAAGFGSFATFFLPGLGIAKGAQALQAVPKLAMLLGATSSATLEAMVEAGSTYERSRNKGMDDEGASSAATFDFILNLPSSVVLNNLGVFSHAGKPFLKALKSAAGEGSQEFLQQVVSNVAASDPALEGAMASFFVGAITGGVTMGVVSTAEDLDTLRQAKILKDRIKDLNPRDNLARDESGKPIEINPIPSVQPATPEEAAQQKILTETIKSDVKAVESQISNESNIKSVIEQAGGKFKAITDMKNSLFEDEPTIYYDTPSGSTKIIRPSQLNVETVQKKIQDFESKFVQRPKPNIEVVKTPVVASEKGQILLETPKIESEISKASVDDIEFLHAGISLPQSTKKLVNDNIQGEVKFSNPEVENRYQSAKGVGPQDLKSKVIATMNNFWARATRVYANLPNDSRFAEIRNILSNQKNVKQVSQDRAIRAIDAITAGMGPKKLDLFTRKVILDDLVRESEAGRPVPFGYSEITDSGLVINKEMLGKDKDMVDTLIEKNPDIKQAVIRRKMLIEAVQNDLVAYGILTEEQIKQDYFRHQVIEYARAKATFGVGQKLKKPRPGYAKKRKGSVSDINTDYVEAEFEVLSQALHDIETMKNLGKIEKSPLNIKLKLMEEAKQKNLKWREIIPEGYTTWQPQDGNILFMANSIPQHVVNEVLDANGKDIGINESDIKKIMAIGGKRKELVLPVEVADTLDNLYQKSKPNFIIEAGKKLTTYWKRWVLMNPRRFFKYNYQNFIGDFDAVIAGDSGILKKFIRANNELVDVMLKGKPMTPEMREYFERGGLTSQMTVQELPELKKLEIFQRLSSDKSRDIKNQINLWRRYWQGVGTFTTYRESIFRYAAYLHYKELFSKGGKVNYGASIKDEVDALNDPMDKAAKVATELLGDYANITALGQDMRESVIPFYSWLEINMKRYQRLFRNSFSEGWQEGIRTSATVAGVKGSFFLAKWLLRAAAMTSMAAIWNHLMFPDEEEEIGEYDKNRMHIILGRTENEEIIILRGQSAFADILEWLGLDGAPTYWKEYFDGKASFADIFGRIPMTDLPAFGLSPLEGKIGMHPAAMKMIRGINPLYKLPLETMTGKSLPVFDDRSWQVEDKMRNILKAISLENEYDALMKNPTRGYRRSLIEAFVAIQDPMENAYRYIQGEKYKFLETVKGRGGSGSYYSPKSILYRKYKKALRFDDMEAIERIETEMEAKGVTEEDIQQSLKSADPLSGLSRADRAEFIDYYLSQRDRETSLIRSQEYYRQTFLER